MPKFVRSLNIANRVHTPFITYGTPKFKTLSRASVGISPKGSYSLVFGWNKDNQSEQFTTVGQGATGGELPFTLGTDTLGGTTDYQERHMDLSEGGEFRAIAYRVRSLLIDEDMELHSISSWITKPIPLVRSLPRRT